jgi:CRP-like cAMP-binding protein
MAKALRALFTQHGAALTVRPGAAILSRGDPIDGLYYLAEGQALMHSSSLVGRAVAFEILRPGRIFGWQAMISGGARRVDVTALKRCQLWAMRKERFAAVLLENPACAMEAVRICVALAGQRTRQVEDLVLSSLEERLGKWILDRFRDDDVPLENGRSINLTVSQAVIAQMIGMSRESVNKQLQKWCGRNVIAMHGRQLRIANAAELRRHAAPEAWPCAGARPVSMA